MLRVEYPPSYHAERGYIFSVIFREFLGLDVELVAREGTDVRITRSGDQSRELRIADTLFQTPDRLWLTPQSLPLRPLPVWSGGLPPFLRVAEELPVIYGACLPDGTYCAAETSRVRIGIDIFGSAFFMLSRYEEAVSPVRDRIGRFPADASLAGQEGFLHRPLVNEYVELLWWGLKYLWPELNRCRRTQRVLLSHDVDWPLYALEVGVRGMVRGAAGDLVKRRDPSTAVKRLTSWLAGAVGARQFDMYNTFHWLMNLSENQGLISAFYFISQRSDPALDGNYSMSHPWIKGLLKTIHARGHEIGLHTSFHTYRDGRLIGKEFDLLRAATSDLAIDESHRWGGRQHYLRWEAPTTWQGWNDAGLAYDTTLGFANHVGFRAGTCYEYPVFNLLTRSRLQLRERPLIVMDVSLLGSDYMNLTHAQAWQVCRDLRDRCRRFDGDFTLLWHNSQLVAAADRDLYRAIVASC